jgi:hypothetical protein
MDRSDPRKSGALMPTGRPQPKRIVLTTRQRELVRLALYNYRPGDWTKPEVDKVLDLFRGSEVHIYPPEVEPMTYQQALAERDEMR